MMTWEEAVQWLRSQPEHQELVKFCYYDDPLEETIERFRASDEWDAVRELLRSNMPGKVLDLGAGRGISTYAFARERCEVVALEPDQSDLVGAGAIRSILVAHPELNVQVVTEYAEVLPFSDSSFDIVYGRAVMHHARDLEVFCRECARVLKPGGVMLGTREHVISQKEDLQLFLDSHILHRHYGGECAYLLSDYRDALSNAGLNILKCIGPYESVVNFAPAKIEQIREILVSRFAERSIFPLWICRLLLVSPGFFTREVEMVTREDMTPGRHYSFLAVKP